MVDHAGLIRAGGHTILATDATLRVDAHDAIRIGERGPRRAHRLARRVFAMHALGRHGLHAHAGLRTALEFVELDQRDIGGQVVLVLTRNAACVAADALRRVDEHSITSH